MGAINWSNDVAELRCQPSLMVVEIIPFLKVKRSPLPMSMVILDRPAIDHFLINQAPPYDCIVSFSQ